MIKLGEIIKASRKHYGLTQQQLGETLTVSQSYISAVENGNEIPTPMFIKLFCLLYSVDMKSFSD